MVESSSVGVRFTSLYVHSFINQRDNGNLQMESVQCLGENLKICKQLILACDKNIGCLYAAHVSAGTPSTRTYCSQIASKATCCVIIAAWRHCVEFKVQQFCACQPEQDSHYLEGRCLCQRNYFNLRLRLCHTPMMAWLLRSKPSPNSNFTIISSKVPNLEDCPSFQSLYANLKRLLELSICAYELSQCPVQK